MASHDEPTTEPASPSPSPDRGTAEADRHDAGAQHVPDRPPTPEEEAAAPDETSDSVKAAYREAIERGADVAGEGQIDPAR